ncbi:MAG: hypothetical protein RJQ14_05570 [Marinoscillum sp.]
MRLLQKSLSIIIFFSIIGMGIFKFWILESLSPVITWILSGFGIDIASFEFLSFDEITPNELSNEKIGYFLYFPIYLSLHILFAGVLFWDKPRVRNWLMFSILGVIGTLILLRITFTINEMKYPAHLSDRFLRKLFALPFLLLAIEGSKIIYSDIKKRVGN